MGYYIYQGTTEFRVPVKNMGPMLEAINASFTAGHHSWWDMPEGGFDAIADAFEEMRWPVTIDEDSGDITDICFEGQKLGDEDQFFTTIAPFVADGSFIHIDGEDSPWRWRFWGGQLYDDYPHVTWPPINPEDERCNGLCDDHCP